MTMTMARSAVISLCASLLLCTSLMADDYKEGMKAYKDGNVIEALQFFLGQVTENPKHQKSVDMIKTLLPEVIELRKSRAKKYEETRQWDKAEGEYDRLRRLDAVLQRLTAYDNGELVTWPEIDFGTAQVEAKNAAAEIAYQKGVEAMQIPGNAETAIEFFKEARKYDPDYKDAKTLGGQALYNDGIALINRGDYKAGVRTLWKLRDFFPEGFQDSEDRMRDAIDSAKIKVAVMPFEDLTLRERYGDVGMSMSSYVVSQGVSAEPVFVDFISRDHVYALMEEQDFGASDRLDPSTAVSVGKLIGIDVFVFGRISAITPEYPRDREEHGESHAASFDGTRKYSARWTKHHREGNVRVSASYQVLDVMTGRIVDSDSFVRNAGEVAQWVTFIGDESAIEASVLAYNTTGDVPVAPSEILADRAIQMVSAAVAASVLARYED